MNRGAALLLATHIGTVTTVLLTCARGGLADAPWVLLVFGAYGFCGLLFLFWLFRRETLQAVETFFSRVPYSASLRDLLAVAAAVSSLSWSGAVIAGAGYVGWLVAILLATWMPVVVCLLAARWSIPLGVLTATCIVASLLLENARLGSPFWAENAGIWLCSWVIAAGLSLIASVPIQLIRRRL